MQKRPTSTPEMATDHSIINLRSVVHKLKTGFGYTGTVYERAHRLTAPFQQSRDICLLPLRVCPLIFCIIVIKVFF